MKGKATNVETTNAETRATDTANGKATNAVNWRAPVIRAALWLTGSSVPDNLRTIRRLWRSDRETVDRYRAAKLTRLLRHAHATVPYYSDVLEEAGVVDGEEVFLENFQEIPILTRETLREERQRLQSSDPGPDPYRNTTSGSTGVPVEFVQDDHYWAWNVATKLFYQELAGKSLGEPEVKLWGSVRDLEEGSTSIRTRAMNFLYNRRELNSYRMGDAQMRAHVRAINEVEPTSIWTYVHSMEQLAKYVQRTGTPVHSPRAVITTAGTLNEPVRERIERVFDTRVHNQYGSREVGDVACECPAQDGLHCFPHAAYVEIVDGNGDVRPAGENGRIAVTSLNNFSMPLIRYEIGDMGIASAEPCRCGRPFPTLERVTGRRTDHFTTPDGDLVNPFYLEDSLYYLEWFDRFRIRQTSRDHVVYLFERRSGQEPPSSDLEEIEAATRRLLGDTVDVSFEFPDRIEENDSGKYRYSISEVT